MGLHDGFEASKGMLRLHETVLRKVSADARHPVVPRARDLQAPPAVLVRNPGLDEPPAGARGWARP